MTSTCINYCNGLLPNIIEVFETMPMLKWCVIFDDITSVAQCTLIHI